MNINGLALTPDRIKALREDSGMTQAALDAKVRAIRNVFSLF